MSICIDFHLFVILIMKKKNLKDKAIKRFLVRNIVEQAAVRDVQEACVYDRNLHIFPNIFFFFCDLDLVAW